MNPDEVAHSHQLIEALREVRLTLGSPGHSRNNFSEDSGHGSISSRTATHSENGDLENFVQDQQAGKFTADQPLLSYLSTIYNHRIINHLDPAHFNKAIGKEVLNGAITDAELTSFPVEDIESIKELHQSLQGYAETLLRQKLFVRSQTSRGSAGHQRNQLVNQINYYLLTWVPALYQALTWSYRYSDNQPLDKSLSCLDKCDEKTRALIVELSILNYPWTPMFHLFRLQAKIWRDESSEGVNQCLAECIQQYEKEDGFPDTAVSRKKYLILHTPVSIETSQHHRAEILFNRFFNGEPQEYQKVIAAELFSPRCDASLLKTLENHLSRNFDSAWGEIGRYGYDNRVLETVLKTMAKQPKATQELMIQCWARVELHQSPRYYQKLLSCAKENQLAELIDQIAQIGELAAQGLPPNAQAPEVLDLERYSLVQSSL